MLVKRKLQGSVVLSISHCVSFGAISHRMFYLNLVEQENTWSQLVLPLLPSSDILHGNCPVIAMGNELSPQPPTISVLINVFVPSRLAEVVLHCRCTIAATAPLLIAIYSNKPDLLLWFENNKMSTAVYTDIKVETEETAVLYNKQIFSLFFLWTTPKGL